ncbi:hypothetical protein Rhow_000853 [Rhodococcus wratislaviensis]|uniref:Uncharacterized protein n=1 Tax=Rhodococcus wratislaviensis TaxID=44752 RepID=A0A402C309_RHOWR|nr:hypothetical protein [Rhodococcus wratislaviensis]GCE37969.1 hypothetical protein Rhow_000853 [Rhodococcus wratislaviensis]
MANYADHQPEPTVCEQLGYHDPRADGACRHGCDDVSLPLPGPRTRANGLPEF